MDAGFGMHTIRPTQSILAFDHVLQGSLMLGSTNDDDCITTSKTISENEAAPKKFLGDLSLPCGYGFKPIHFKTILAPPGT
eukprot:scaffold17245_cov68-Cyclotella_meneghiniana.AAC.1